MAVPLPVTEQPLATPFEAPVGAEAVVLYPEAEAEQVQTWSYFNSEEIETEVYIGASPGYAFRQSIVAPTEYEESGQFVGGSCMFCLPGGTSVFLSREKAATFDIWRKVPGTPGLSAVFFRWTDVSTFFWYFPAGDVVIAFDPPNPDDEIPEIPIGPECPPDEATVSLLCACLPGGRPTVLTWVALAPSCPVDTVTWDNGGVLSWDNGFACWAPEG